MKKVSIISIAASAIFSLSTCSNEELVEGMLPEGKYPLEIASVTMKAEVSEQPWTANAPQTRVAESADGNSSVWENGDVFCVKLDNTNQIGTFSITEATTGTATAQNTVYWTQRTDNATAWYPQETTINLADQSGKLAYVLKATTPNASCNNAVQLNFTHQLAKVRVLIDGTANMKDGKVEIKGYTTCTNDKGAVSGNGEPGWISMHPVTYSDGRIYYEANLVPATINKEAFRVTQNNGLQATLDLNAPLSLTAGQMHEVTLTVNKKGTTVVDLTAQSGDSYYVAPNASVIIDGKGQSLNKQLVLGAGATVMLKNVVLQPVPKGNGIVCNGSATIILSGRNKLVGNTDDDEYIVVGCGILITGELATLAIEGPGELEAIGKGRDGCGIGAIKYASIVINGGTITASSSNPYSHDQSWGCPGIGVCPGEGYENCGDITINGGHITAQGGPCSAGIGGAAMGNCGNILIQGKNTVVNATKGDVTSAFNPSWIQDIGEGDDCSCGTITFRNGATVNGKKYN